VVHGAADHIDLTGSTTDLTSGDTRTITATIRDLNGNVVDSGPDASLSVSFSQSGTGSVTGTGSATAALGVATKTVTGTLVGSVSIDASATNTALTLITDTAPVTFTVVHGAADHIDLTGSTGDLTPGDTPHTPAPTTRLN